MSSILNCGNDKIIIQILVYRDVYKGVDLRTKLDI